MRAGGIRDTIRVPGVTRSRLVLEAVTRELARRQRAALRTSLSAPHPDSLLVAETGMVERGRTQVFRVRLAQLQFSSAQAYS
jgi:hypothetical protein